MIRLGLCCIFRNEPIRFRRTTAKHLANFPRGEQLARLSEICLHNAGALRAALSFCLENGIGCFRVNSRILPLKTHPDAGYELEELPGGDEIRRMFLDCGEFGRMHGIRLTFHPDQFILLSSPRESVTRKSIDELAYKELAVLALGEALNMENGT